MSNRPAQPAGKRAQVRGGGGDASDGACVVHERAPTHYVFEIKQDHVRALMRSTRLDEIRARWTDVFAVRLLCMSLEQTTLTRLACAAQP